MRVRHSVSVVSHSSKCLILTLVQMQLSTKTRIKVAAGAEVAVGDAVFWRAFAFVVVSLLHVSPPACRPPWRCYSDHRSKKSGNYHHLSIEVLFKK